MNNDIFAAFQNPAPMLRGVPFWSWNAELQPDELRRQIRLLKQMGFGGFFMHSRVGLDTPYLSERWFECVGACVDEAKKQDMLAWIYDEDRWPSGAAGGLVTGASAEHRVKHVVMHESRKALSKDAELVAVFDLALDGEGKLVSYARAADNAGAKPAAKAGAKAGAKADAKNAKGAGAAASSKRVFFAVETAPTSSWYNHGAYLDVMSPDAVNAFIESTHEAYRKRFAKDFGGAIPGVFTDEPNYQSTFLKWFGAPAMPWTPKLPEYFRGRFGRELAGCLPELFIPLAGDAPSAARYQYYDSITQLFCDSFGKLIGDWCGKNKLLYTGHLLEESTLIRQTHEVGSCMRFYQHMQAPGMDLLTENAREYDTAKQLSSVARQFSRKWRLSETYGCTGWDFNFAGHKALGDWQTALGINLRCPHLSWYSMLGQAKRDYPGSIFYQSPWFAHYPMVEDYFSRINSIMTRGAEVRRLLVVHPVESAWLYMAHDQGLARPEALSNEMRRLRDLLLGQHLDFDYGEETLMRDFGCVEKKKAPAAAAAAPSPAAPQFRLKDALYDAIIVPPLDTLRATTLARLEAFAAAGGAVIWTGRDIPALVDAAPSDRASRLAAKTTIAPDTDALLRALAPYRSLSLADPSGAEIPSLLYQLREDADAAYLFICNTSFAPAETKMGVTMAMDVDAPLVRDRTLAHPAVAITGLPAFAGAPIECDPQTGAFHLADAEKLPNGAWRISTDFPALGTRLYIYPRAAAATNNSTLHTPHSTLPTPRPRLTTLQTIPLKPAHWSIRRTEPNPLLLEYPQLKIAASANAKAAYGAPQYVLDADNAVRDALGISRRGGSMAQPWWQKQHLGEPSPSRYDRFPWGPPPPSPPPTAALDATGALPITLRYTFQCDAIPDSPVDLALERPRQFDAITFNGIPLNKELINGWWVDPSLERLPLPPVFRLGENTLELNLRYTRDHSGLEFMYLLGDIGASISAPALIPTLTAPPRRLKLGDWTPQGLPFYSGAIQYTTAQKLPAIKSGQRLIASLPLYAGTAARVLLNGRPAGITAWAPHEIDLTPSLPPIETSSEIELAIEIISSRRNSHGPFHLDTLTPNWTGAGEFQSDNHIFKWRPTPQLVPCGLMCAPELLVRG